ncbi:MAG TPA: zf-HC2 domain-containing protein [Myxococcaceae bacterium]|nr:zf-HC2 domain-containing protein [Myxococcaceae bacterium]
MTCDTARGLILDAIRGRLPDASARELRQHLETCAACRAFEASERALSEALDTKLPQYAAPLALKRRLQGIWPHAAAPVRARRWSSPLARMAAVAAAVAVVAGGAGSVLATRSAERERLAGESVNDHLRLLAGAPLATVTGGLHEVKPWFGGKLDFAPSLRFAGDEDFPLLGGAVERFLDRPAAVFVFQRRLHKVSLFVMSLPGLDFPLRPTSRPVRGFNVVLWQANDQGYALVSDLNLDELLQLQKRIATAGP